MSNSNSALPNISQMSLPQKVVHNIAATNAAMEKMAAAHKSQTEKQAAVNSLIPSAVDALVKHQRIREDQREKAAAALADPVQTLKLLIKVAAHRNDDEGMSRLGQGVSPTSKTASHNGPYVGGRSSGQIKQSSAALFSGLGLPVPASE